MATFAPNLSALNTSGMSSYLDPTGPAPGPTSSAMSTLDAHRPVSRASSTGERTIDVMRAAQQSLDPDQDIQ